MPLSLKIFTRTAEGISFLGDRVLDGERVTVGRSKECTLSLEDPQKCLSRVHAEFVQVGNGYLLKATSKTSPVLVNGQAQAAGSEVIIRTGDTVTMDVYELEIAGMGGADIDPDATQVGVPALRPGASQRAAASQPVLRREVGTVRPSADLQPGQLIAGRFRVEAQVGVGRTGAVFRARDELHGEDIALKLIQPSLIATEAARQRLMGEMKVALRLRHPGIVSVHDIQDDGTHLFLTMEFLLGRTLRAAMQERQQAGRQWSEAEALAIVRPMAEALAYAHQFTAHLDVKPANVWLGLDGSVKLRGFGIAQGLTGSQMTQAAAETGSAYYLAPEQLAGATAVDHRADQYALGAMLYEMLTGRIPAGRIVSLGTARPDVSRAVSDAVDKALSGNADDRFLTDALFLAALSTPARPEAPAAPFGRNIGLGAGKAKMLGIGAAAIAGVLVLAVLGPTLMGLLPHSEARKKAEQRIADLDGQARALINLLEGDRRELKEAVAGSNRDVERIEGQLRAARTGQERAGLDAARREAQRVAKQNAALESRARDQIEGPNGLPKAEGNLRAAAEAAKNRDEAGAVRVLEETVGSLMQTRSGIAEDRKAVLAEQDRRKEELQVAEARAAAEGEARAKVEAEARAARARAESEARARAEAQARVAAEREAQLRAMADARLRLDGDARRRAIAESDLARSRAAQGGGSGCLGRLAGTWSHAVGGTWTFSGNQATLVLNSTNYGPRAQQITVLALSSCDNDTMTYKIVRAALINTVDPSFAYDKTPANAPNAPNWSKVNSQGYSISGNGLRFGNYTYAKR